MGVSHETQESHFSVKKNKNNVSHMVHKEALCMANKGQRLRDRAGFREGLVGKIVQQCSENFQKVKLWGHLLPPPILVTKYLSS